MAAPAALSGGGAAGSELQLRAALGTDLPDEPELSRWSRVWSEPGR